MFSAAKRALSPTSYHDDADTESYADTYFREIGFKTGDNSLIGSTESPELDYYGDDVLEDVDRSLGLLEDSSLATNVEQAVASYFEEGQYAHYKQQLPPSSSNNGLTTSKAYSSPFHTYFGALADPEEGEEETPPSANDMIPPSPRGSFNITYPKNIEDDVSISTLGEESVRRKPVLKYGQPQKSSSESSCQKKTRVKKGADLDELDLKKTRTASTMEEGCSEDNSEDQGAKSPAKSLKQSASRSSEDDASAADRKRWRAIYYLIGSSILLLSGAAVVLGISIAELRSSDESSFSQERQQGSGRPTNNFEMARKDLLQIIGTVSPDSLSSISDTNTPQYQAFDWMVYNPDYLEMEADRIIQRWCMAVLYFSLGGDDTQLAPNRKRWVDSNSDNASLVVENWLSDSHECFWYTTDDEDVCDAEGRLIGLHLSEVGLSGSIPPEVSLLSQSLERFYLPNNNITGTIPVEIGYLSNLVRLQLSSNAIEGTIPTELAKLSNLVVLGLGLNRLTGSLPKALGVLNHLTTFGIEGNSIEGAIPTEFGQMTSLKYLTVEFNRLDGSIPSEFGTLENLQKLAFHQNDFEGKMPTQICEMTNTTDLVVSADCAELQCECCDFCCIGCTSHISGMLINKVAATKPTPTGSPDSHQPASFNPQEEVENNVEPTVSPNIALWQFALNAAGLTDFPSQAPSDAPSDSMTRVPSPAPTECSAGINVKRSCFESDRNGIEVDFQNCRPMESDWVGLFKEDQALEAAGIVAPSADDAELWLRSCGNQKCSVPVTSGTVSFGKESRHVKQGEYRILLVQEEVIIATSRVFEVRKKC